MLQWRHIFGLLIMAESNKDKDNNILDEAKQNEQVKEPENNSTNAPASNPEQADLGWGSMGNILVRMLLKAGDNKQAALYALSIMSKNLRAAVEKWVAEGKDLAHGPAFEAANDKEASNQNEVTATNLTSPNATETTENIASKVNEAKEDSSNEAEETTKANSKAKPKAKTRTRAKAKTTKAKAEKGAEGTAENSIPSDEHLVAGSAFEFLNNEDLVEEERDLFAEFNAKDWPDKLMVLPVFGRPLLPSQIMPLQVAPRWRQMIHAVLNTPDKMLAIFSMPMDREDPEINIEDFARVMTVGRIIQCRDGEDIQFVVQALGRVKLEPENKSKVGITCKAHYLEAVVPEPNTKEGLEVRALSMTIIHALKELVGCNPIYFEELKQYVGRFDPNNPSLLADCAAAITNSSFEELYDILKTVDLLPRLELCLQAVNNELNVARIQSQIKEKVGQNINEKQREAILREQLKEIKNELGLGENADSSSDVEKLKARMDKLNPPKEVAERFKNEINRMQNIDVSSAEYGVARDYLECLTTVPWGVYAGEGAEIKEAKKVLETDHEGLKEVKECIVESLAVSVFNKNTDESKRGTGLLFVGPPGVGKTSIGRSVARALKRPFFRVSLGGVSDESEIRGHRRTYIGAYAGKLVQALRTSKAMNPVIMLDEVDKLKTSASGDPAAALLEVLDPEQNNSFTDHYLDVPLDLSGCFFICTANSMETIPAPLRDRMEVIQLNGYLTDEKFRIAKKYLLPKIVKESGISTRQVKLGDAVIRRIIEGYAREAGVRNLERHLKRIVRKCVVKLMTDDSLKSVTIKEQDLVKYLGVAPFDNEFLLQGIGIATGLAWNSVGGCALPIEAEIISRTAKSGGVQVTGNLGKVMKESVEIAFSYIRATLKDLAPDTFANEPKVLDEALVHVHVPEGAVEKDGPSAGITIASALLSMVSRKAPRQGFAMTGEISLTGRVLAIGGLEEKVMGARRMGINNLIVPRFNKSNVDNMPAEIKAGVNFYYVDNYPEVAKILFGVNEPKPSYTAPLVDAAGKALDSEVKLKTPKATTKKTTPKTKTVSKA